MEKPTVFILIFIFLAQPIFAETLDSSNYKIGPVTPSQGGDSISSSSYNNIIYINTNSESADSSNYIITLGFLQNILLADGQPCTSASQCEGGFCCSSECKSTSCPTPSGGETAAAGGAEAAGAAGGGGGVTVTTLPEVKEDFTVSPDELKFSFGLGDEEEKKVLIKNIGTTALSLKADITGVNEFLQLSESSFDLAHGEEKVIYVNAIGKKLGSYFGEISISGDSVKKAVSVILEIESTLVLFDVKLDILPEYKQISPGEDLKIQVTLLNVGAPRLVDVFVTYLIKDKLGRIIYESSETFAVDKQKSYTNSIRLPKALDEGRYLAAIEVTYAESFAVSSDTFNIDAKPEKIVSLIVRDINFSLIVLIIALFLVLIIAYKKTKKYI